MDGGGVKPPAPKRQMKTPFQLEILEAAYAADSYPPESVRADLSVKLDLTDRQLQMWFCHRRLKDRNKDKHSGKNGAGIAETEMKSGKSKKRKLMSQLQEMELDQPVMRRHHDSPSLRMQLAIERRALSFVESQLGESLREDGPVLGIEFDPLPPDAFGAALEEISSYPKKVGKYSSGELEFNNAQTYLPANEFISKSSRSKKMRLPEISNSQNSCRDLQEYNFFSERPSIRDGSREKVSTSFYDSLEPKASKSSSRLHRESHQFSAHGRHSHALSFGASDYEISPDRQSFTCEGEGSDASAASDEYQHEEESFQMEMKQRKSYEAQKHKKVEAHEKLSRKEIEKQDILKRKLEERTRREMERYEREMRKEEERLMRERQREEERYQREQRREAERLEKFFQKENQRAEKLRLKEEERKQREEARQKAATERASARKVAREAMELIDDERLELMELAASSEKLPSFLSLDYKTLQNLEAYKVFLPSFPPQAVQLKKPFTGKPWIDSDQNVGNLLMVWRFLITFADILELWPFTLDEFVQALHDYDPRLLSEIHISLLTSIIKDIEDAAKTPNQSGAGGHLQIVDGAYAWGFDIRSWQCHLNPATWPEVLRQLALSAGFGPQLKKKQDEDVYLGGKNEGPDCVDIVSNLRNGAAAENAVALMREKGYNNNRRSRHRLTPGTVKFAVYHVLCFEGENGLTILQVVDRVQKSGLRDLTTSKTPDASVGAALSRDTLLFERIAPCTYRVRAPYRKDLADAPTILAAAREKLKIFENGNSDSEDEEKDPESPEDDGEAVSDGEYAEGLKLKDAMRLESLSKKMSKHLETIPDDGKDKHFGQCLSTFQTSKCASKAPDIAENFKSTCNKDFGPAEIDESNIGEPWVQGLTEGEYSDLTVDERLNALVALVGVAIEGNSIRVALEERLEAANCLKKQMWAEVQLDKRRMKDDSTSRAPYYSSHFKNDADIVCGITEGGAQSPMLRDKSIDNDISLNPSTKQEFATNSDVMLDKDRVHVQQHGYVATEKSRTELKTYLSHKAEDMYAYRSLPLGEDRRHNRYWQFVTSSKNDPGTGRIFFESHDGRWKLIDTVEVFDALMKSLDTRGVRESHLHSMLKRVEVTFKNTLKKKTNECVSAESADVREITDSSPSDRTGESDSPLSSECGGNIDVVKKSVSFKTEIGGNEMERKVALKRYCHMQKWLWKECSSSSVLCAMKFGKKRCSELLAVCTSCNATYFCNEHHCAYCHQTFVGSDINQSFPEHVLYCEEKKQNTGLVMSICENLARPARIELLKSQLAFIEASIPAEALQSHWTNDCRKLWGSRLHASVSAETIFQLFTQLEFAINPDYLSKNYETTKEHLGSTSQCFGVGDNDAAPVLPWIPITTAAVGLRLMEFDASMCYMPQQKMVLDKDDPFNKKYPGRHALGSTDDTCMAEAPGPSDYAHPDTLEDCNKRRRSGPNVLENRNKRRRSGPDVSENHNKRSRSGSYRGRGGRSRGQGRSAYRGGGSASGRVLLAGTNKKRTQGPRRSIGSSRGGASTRGLRTARNRQTRFVAEAVEKEVAPRSLQKAVANFHIELQDSPQSSESEEDWAGERTYERGANHKNDQSSGDEEYADDGDQGAEDFTVSYRNKEVSVSDSENDEGDADEDEDDGLGYEKPHHGREEDEDGGKNEDEIADEDDVDEGIDGDESDEEESSDEDGGSSSSSEDSDQ